MFAEARNIERVEECYFYHTMDLPRLGLIKGHWDLRQNFGDYVGHVPLERKSVLDVGTATGFLSFEAERRGARRVVSFDMSDVRQQAFVPFPQNPPQREPNEWLARYSAEMERWKNAYWLAHRLLGSKAEAFYGDIYDLPLELGKFDVVLVGSVLEHLRDPIKALEAITRLATETLVIVTPILEDNEPLARFEPRISAPQNDYTWWTYSTGLYRELLGILGFQIDRITTAEYWHEYAQRLEPRTTLVASRVQNS